MMRHPTNNTFSSILSSIFLRTAFYRGLGKWAAVALLVWFILSRFLLRRRSVQGGMIVVLNGFPGSGKSTVLERVRALLPADNKPALIDRHLLLHPVEVLIPGGSVENYALQRKLRGVFFRDIRKLAMEGRIVYMTACLNARDEGVFREHLALVEGTDVPLVWVDAVCGLDILLERVRSPGRRMNSKLTNPRILESMVWKECLIDAEVMGGGLRNLVVPGRCLKMDGDVEESARAVLKIVESVK